MTAYDPAAERAVRVGRLVDEWTRSGLLTGVQRDAIVPSLAVPLRRTNRFLRVTLLVITAVILQAALGLFVVLLGSALTAFSVGVVCVGAAVVFGWFAAWLARRYAFYRFGVEEANAVAAIVLATVGAALMTSSGDDGMVVAGVTAGGVAALAAYRWFGFLYAAVAAIACAAALPFPLLDFTAASRLVALLVLAAAAFGLRRARAALADEFPGDTYAVLEALTWLGAYALANLQISGALTSSAPPSWLYWSSYAATWILPALALWTAACGRDRWLLRAALAMALASIASNQGYLGSPRHEWDPVVFGLLLIGGTLAVRRWLAAGVDGARSGYTAVRILASDAAALDGLAMVSALQTQSMTSPATPPAAPGIGDGGRSGGAGGGAAF
ncbi:MAG: hypothetical protein ABI880_02390 [Acidobacteriota bacterium]